MAWSAPVKDGGSKVTGYVVEKKEAGSDFWIRAHSTPTVSDTQFVVGDLAENAEYEFRVKAVNKAGESEPSSSTGRIKVTEFPGEFKQTF